MRRPFFLLLILFILSSCAPVNTKVMYNPSTGDTKECKRDPLKNWAWEEKAVLEKCANEYRKLGYIDSNEIENIETIQQQPNNTDNNANDNDLSRKLKILKSAYDEGFITEEEYNSKKAQLLDNY